MEPHEVKRYPIPDGTRAPIPDVCSGTKQLLALMPVRQNGVAGDSCRGLASGSSLCPAQRHVKRSSLTGRREGEPVLERAGTLVPH